MQNERLINVYDHGNPDRLLGHFGERDFPFPVDGQDILKVAVMPSMPLGPSDPFDPMIAEFTAATFFKGWENTDPLTKRLCLTTHADLEDLMTLRQFRLPGEDIIDANRRRFTRGHYA